MELDLPRLQSWLQSNLADFEGPLVVHQFAGGQSNPTYMLETPHRRYVLRRKPPGVLVPSAHAIDREYRVLAALAEHSHVPVPLPLALCMDDEVAGTSFYVMTYVEGRIFWDPRLPEVAPSERRLHLDAMNATLADLHGVDWRRADLADFGKPTHYVQRQFARWTRQYLDDELAGRVPVMDRLIEWLQVNLPTEDGSSIVHGDYRCDNLVFHPTEPTVIAILDWELATIGHPIADFAYHLMVYRLPTLAFPGLAQVDLVAEALPSEAEYVKAYCRRTGRTGIPHLDFYLAFCMFRLAASFHGIRGRMIRGSAVGTRAQEYARHVETLADLAWAQAERAMRRN
jgi:aminoglycoside phosphotransferase (APT) family kinase protein